MPAAPKERYRHSHSFGMEARQAGERKTHVVIAITAMTMVIEITAGIVYGSMALLADGIHMASHVAALGISAFAYAYARRHANDPRFSFGAGKVNAVGGYTGSVLLGLFALLMAWESVHRFFNPVAIAFDQALIVAALGLVVNGVSVFVLGTRNRESTRGDGEHGMQDGHDHHHDHNLRAAYLHVLADAITSLTAIIALLFGKTLGVLWMDPLMGVAGSLLVARWSYGLMKQTLTVLLDYQEPRLEERVRLELASMDASDISDLHIWSIAPGKFGAIIGIASTSTDLADTVRSYLSGLPELAHITVEVHRTRA